MWLCMYVYSLHEIRNAALWNSQKDLPHSTIFFGSRWKHNSVGRPLIFKICHWTHMQPTCVNIRPRWLMWLVSTIELFNKVSFPKAKTFHKISYVQAKTEHLALDAEWVCAKAHSYILSRNRVLTKNNSIAWHGEHFFKQEAFLFWALSAHFSLTWEVLVASACLLSCMYGKGNRSERYSLLPKHAPMCPLKPNRF